MAELTEAKVYASARRKGLFVRRVRGSVVYPQWVLSHSFKNEGEISYPLVTGTLEEIAAYLDGRRETGRYWQH